jgi:hypothetical protein
MGMLTVDNTLGGELDVLIGSYTNALVPKRGTISIKIVDGKIMSVEDMTSPKVVAESRRAREAFELGMGWGAKVIATLAPGETKDFDPQPPNDVGKDITAQMGEYLLLRSKGDYNVVQITNNIGEWLMRMQTSPQDFPIKRKTTKILNVDKILYGAPKPFITMLQVGEQLILNYI